MAGKTTLNICSGRHTNKDEVAMKYLIVLSVLISSAWSSTQEITSKSSPAYIIQLIEKAKIKVPEGVIGTFQLPITAIGKHRDII